MEQQLNTLNNMQRKTKIIIASIIFVGGLTTYLVYRRTQKTKLITKLNDILDAKIKDPSGQNGGQKIITADVYNALPDGVFPIKFGDASKKVYDIQRLLNSKFGSSLDLDGKYGESTWEIMCSKIWNTGWFTTTATDCYDTDFSGIHKKAITQKDYESLKA